MTYCPRTKLMLLGAEADLLGGLSTGRECPWWRPTSGVLPGYWSPSDAATLGAWDRGHARQAAEAAKMIWC